MDVLPFRLMPTLGGALFEIVMLQRIFKVRRGLGFRLRVYLLWSFQEDRFLEEVSRVSRTEEEVILL